MEAASPAVVGQPADATSLAQASQPAEVASPGERWLAAAAAKAGFPDAAHALSKLYETGAEGVEENEGKAVEYLRQAAEGGVVEAQGELGAAYEAGRGVEEDDAEAAKWYRMAADQGHNPSQVALGLMCLFGRGVEEDREEGLRLLRAAAEGGGADAQRTLKEIEEQVEGWDPEPWEG